MAEQLEAERIGPQLAQVASQDDSVVFSVLHAPPVPCTTVTTFTQSGRRGRLGLHRAAVPKLL